MAREATGSVQHKRGRWWARVTVKDAQGNTHRPWVDLERPDIPNTPEGREQAQALALERATLARGGVYERDDEPETEKPLTLARIMDKWFALIDSDPGDLRGSTVYDYKARLRANVLPVAGSWEPPFTVPQLRSLFRDMKGAKSASTVRNVANALTKMLDDARAEGWVEGDNPMRSRDVRIVLPSQTSPDPEDIVSLPIAAVRTLLGCKRIPQDRRDLYLVAVTSGMRDGELYGIQRKDLDLDSPIPTVKVHQQLASARGKEAPVIDKLKSKWSKRTLPLHPKAAERLRKALDGAEPEAFVFGDGKTRPRDADLMREHLALAGLPIEINEEAVTFHALRRTFATLLEAAEVPGDLVDRMLGHAPQSTRGRHYAAPSLEAMHRAICKILLDDPADGPPRTPDPGGQTRRGESSRAAVQSSPSIVSAERHDCSNDEPPLFLSTPGRSRTAGQRFRKPLLYPLSYGGKCLESEGF